MRRIVPLLAFFVVALGLLASSSGSAAPAPPDKPTRWEYAELQYRRTIAARDRFDADAPPPAVKVSVRWASGDSEIEGSSWDDLGVKLKAPSPKKEATPTMQKLNLLNHLGSEGWELVGQQGSGLTTGFSSSKSGPSSPETWLFKRRVP